VTADPNLKLQNTLIITVQSTDQNATTWVSQHFTTN